MNRKLFVTDIDGTLLHGRDGLALEVVRAAERFVAQGHLFTLCTGRSLRGVQELAERLPLNAPALLLTGSLIYSFERQTPVSHIALDRAIEALIARIMTEFPDMAVQVFHEKDIVTVRSNEIFAAKGIRSEQQEGLTDFDQAFAGDVCKVLLVHPDRERLKQAKALLSAYEQEVGKDLFKADFASRHFFEIVSHDAGKDRALVRLAASLGIPKGDLAVAGDGLTDLPMFAHAGHSFAPEDALERVRRGAKTLFPSAKQLGILEVFEALMD